MSPAERYPALMAYIASRSAEPKWYDQLRADEAEAFAGGLADVAAQLKQAQADYGAYPYNSAMGEFLGLPLRDNHQPAHGYYMAGKVADHFALGEATREVERLIANLKPLRVVAARSKADGKPCRFHVFGGPNQIKIEGAEIVASNGKVRVRLSSNWSTETAMVKAAAALRSGQPYGEAA